MDSKHQDTSNKIQIDSNRLKVAVGLSGGVDSSVSAALLLEQGYDVTGVFLTCWDEDRPGCRINQDRKDALDIALQLKIPFVALDFKQEYREKVIDYFYREYQAGRTPNPDTMCNREIKFGMFYEWALREGFDAVATGHYARVCKTREFPISNFQFPNPNFLVRGSDEEKDLHFAKASRGKQSCFLQRGSDEKKDQSYFLYQLRPEQLNHILFPIGHMSKDQVRQEAQKLGLKTATKPDSQGICFIGQVDVREFLRERIEEKRGLVKIRNSKSEITNKSQSSKSKTQIEKQKTLKNLDLEFVSSLEIDASNFTHHLTTIGSHNGTPFYTIGQKVGKEIDQALVAKLAKQGLLDFDTTKMPPLFVIGKDVASNTLIVGQESETYTQEFGVEQINWLVSESQFSQLANSIYVRIRHGGELVKATINPIVPTQSIQVDKLVVKTSKPIRGVAPGQACVFYSDNSTDAIVLGGGIVE